MNTPPLFEKLEPRILLSADLIPLPIDADPVELPDPVQDTDQTLETQASEDYQDSPQEDTSNSPATPVADSEDKAEPEQQQEPIEKIEETSDQKTKDPITDAVVTEDSEDEKARNEIIFVSEDLANYEDLTEEIAKDDSTTLVVLDSSKDGIEQISETLASLPANTNIDGIHLLSHGTDGNIKFGSTWLNSGNVDEYSTQIAGWSDSLSENGDILLYGCDLAATEAGEQLIQELADLTGADVAASDDTTGHQSRGGDWILEYQSGEIETQLPVSKEIQNDWVYILAEETIADNFDSSTYENNDGTKDWSSSWVEFGDDGDPATSKLVGVQEDALRIITASEDGDERSISRIANLSDALTASLTFDYKTLNYPLATPSGDGVLNLEISIDGGNSWQKIADYTIKGNDLTGKTEDIDISNYISGATEIKFSSTGENKSGASEGEKIFTIDNLKITYTTDGNSAPITTETNPIDPTPPGPEDPVKPENVVVKEPENPETVQQPAPQPTIIDIIAGQPEPIQEPSTAQVQVAEPEPEPQPEPEKTNEKSDQAQEEQSAPPEKSEAGLDLAGMLTGQGNIVNPANEMAASLAPFSVDLSFRDLPMSDFSLAATQNGLIKDLSISFEDSGDEKFSFSSEDYSLLDLEYRDRTAQEYEIVRRNLDVFREEIENEAVFNRTVVGSAIAASTGLSAGYVVWLLRSGVLFSSILASLPAWQLADPLAVLTGRTDSEDDEDDSIEEMISKQAEAKEKKNPQRRKHHNQGVKRER